MLMQFSQLYFSQSTYSSSLVKFEVKPQSNPQYISFIYGLPVIIVCKYIVLHNGILEKVEHTQQLSSYFKIQTSALVECDR